MQAARRVKARDGRNQMELPVRRTLKKLTKNISAKKKADANKKHQPFLQKIKAHLTVLKYFLDPTGSGFMVLAPGVQFAGQTSPFFS